MPSNIGLIKLVSNTELLVEEQAEEERAELARQANNAPVLQGLAGYVMEKWGDARDAKQYVLPRLQASHRARMGEYDPAKLANIREFGGSEVYLRIIPNKCMILEALLKDVYLGQTDKPWSLRPTAKPNFPSSIETQIKQQLASELAAVYVATGQMPDDTAVSAAKADMTNEAEERVQDAVRSSVARMDRKMEDQLSEGGFSVALAEFIADFVTYPTAIIKGPVLRRRKQLSWSKAEQGTTEPVVEEVIIPEFERVDPFRLYPAPGARGTQDGWLIEHLSLSYDEIYEMLGSPGVNDEAVRAVLRESEDGTFTDWMGWSDQSHKPDIDGMSDHMKRETHDIDCIQFCGPVKGRDLIEWDTTGELKGEIDDPDAAIEASVWLIGQWVVKAHLNYDPLGVRPYFAASYKQTPGNFWGEAPPDMLSDVADVMNCAARALNNNMSMASGPMVGINTDRLQDGEDLTTMTPWKQFQLKDAPYGNNADRPLEFFQPQMYANELLAVIDKFYQYGDSFSMIPRAAAGDTPTGGVGRTASGFALQLDAAGKGLKAAVLNIDAALSGMLGKLYNHNMQFDTDETLKGDAQVVARGATGLMQIESIRMRRNEFAQVTNNPYDQQILGVGGRAYMLGKIGEGLEMDQSKLFQGASPDGRMQQPQPQAAQPQQGPQMSEETLSNGAPVHDTFSPQPGMTP